MVTKTPDLRAGQPGQRCSELESWRGKGALLHAEGRGQEAGVQASSHCHLRA